MAQELIRSSLIRELGEAYHSDDGNAFRVTYNSALAVSGALAVLAGVIFFGLWLILPLFNIPDELMAAAGWLVAARGVQTVIVLVLAAPFNMYKVTERMVLHNALLIAIRAAYVAGVLWLLLFDTGTDPGRGVTMYSIISSVLVIAIVVVAVLGLLLVDRRLMPDLTLVSRASLARIAKMSGWNVGATAATMSYRRLAPVLMNLAVGLSGNLVLGMAILLTVSVRRLTEGMTEGVDAVATRLSTTEGEQAVQTLMHHSIRLHGVASFPLAVLVLILAEPLLLAWVGDTLQDQATTVPMTIVLVRILAIGMVARAISDGWMRVLYGAGQVAFYAPYVIAGGVLNPLLFLLLLQVLPESLDYTAVAWAYSAVLVGVNALTVPFVGARSIGLPFRRLLTPLIRPFVLALVCAPIPLLAMRRIDDWNFLWLILVGGAYGAVYVVLCWRFLMERDERQRFARAALRRLPLRMTG